MSQEALDDIEQWPVLESLSLTPSLAEVSTATRQMSSGKAAGPDGIPAEVFKYGGMKLNRKLTSLLRKICKRYRRSFATPTSYTSTSLKATGHPATTTEAFPYWLQQVKYSAESC